MLTNIVCSPLQWNDEVQLLLEHQETIDKLKAKQLPIKSVDFETEHGRVKLNNLLVINIFPNLVENVLIEINSLSRLISIIGEDIVHSDEYFENRCIIIASYLRNLERYDNIYTLDEDLNSIISYIEDKFVIIYKSVDPNNEYFDYYL